MVTIPKQKVKVGGR